MRYIDDTLRDEGHIFRRDGFEFVSYTEELGGIRIHKTKPVGRRILYDEEISEEPLKIDYKTVGIRYTPSKAEIELGREVDIREKILVPILIRLQVDGLYPGKIHIWKQGHTIIGACHVE